MRRVIIISITVLIFSGFFIIKNTQSVRALAMAPDLWLEPLSSSTLSTSREDDVCITTPTNTTSSTFSATTTILSSSTLDNVSTTGDNIKILSSSPSSTPTSSIQQIISTSTLNFLWSQIKINEVMINPTTGTEWVELYNLATSSLDLAGGQICDNTGKSCKATTGTIESASWLVIDLQTNRYLNNGGDSVILQSPTNIVIDSLVYANSLVPDKGESLIRKADGVDTDDNDDWAVTLKITPGQANIFIVPVLEQTKVETQPQINSGGGESSFTNESFQSQITDSLAANQGGSINNLDNNEVVSTTVNNNLSFSKKIVLEEIFPNPIGSDSEQEYIALKNLSSSTINLQDWQLADLSKSYNLSGQIKAGQILFYYRSSTSIALNNNKEEVVKLIDPQNNLIDKIGYNQAPEGKKYKRNGQEWEWVGELELSSLASSTLAAEKKLVVDHEDCLGEMVSSTTSSSLKKKSVKNLEEDITKNMSLIQARQLDKGKKVKVIGVASVLPNVFASQYLYISDSNSGIQVYSYSKEFPNLKVGDQIEVNGEISQAYGIKRIKIKTKDNIKILQRGLSVPIISSSISGLDESRLGSLVKVSGLVTEIKTNYLYIDDGESEIMIYFKNGAKIDKKQFKLKDHLQIIGVFEQGRNDWQIWPRSQADIKFLDLSGSESATTTKQASLNITTNNSKDITRKYLVLTIIAIVLLLLTYLIKSKGKFIWQRLKQLSFK